MATIVSLLPKVQAPYFDVDLMIEGEDVRTDIRKVRGTISPMRSGIR